MATLRKVYLCTKCREDPSLFSRITTGHGPAFYDIDNGFPCLIIQDAVSRRLFKGCTCLLGPEYQNSYTESPGRCDVLRTSEDETFQVQGIKHSEDPDSSISDQSHGHVTDISKDNECPICFNLCCSPIQVTKCGHVFCEECLRSLLKSKPVDTPCPLCRQVISGCRRDDYLTHTLKSRYPSYHEWKGRSDPLPQFRVTTSNNNIASEESLRYITDRVIGLVSFSLVMAIIVQVVHSCEQFIHGIVENFFKPDLRPLNPDNNELAIRYP